MKYLLSFLMCCTLASLSAQEVSGLYSGTLINDSTGKTQSYALGLSEYRDKITGYSYTTFVVNDTFYYSIKRIKAARVKGELVVEDVKMLANNFPESPARGVRQTSSIALTSGDTMTHFKGTWKTNQTKQYYSLHGGLDLKRDRDSAHSALINHLYELGELERPQPVRAIARTRPAVEKKTNPAQAAVRVKEQGASAAVVPFDQRAIRLMQTVEVASDSVVLSFFDNGVVDGDTISVYFDGQNIIAHNKLTAAATKKTIHFEKGNTADHTLMLVAENLGTIPPNTGLLIVQDGTNRLELRFTADLRNNASIVFKRRSGTPEP